MNKDILEITGSCRLEAMMFDPPYPPMVSLEYVEHSTDHYYPDHTTSVDLNKEDAQKIIDFLSKHFNINHNTKVCQCDECKLSAWQVDQLLGI